jgi:hypothetical protein
MKQQSLGCSPPVNKPAFLFTPFTVNKWGERGWRKSIIIQAFTREQHGEQRPCSFTRSPLSLPIGKGDGEQAETDQGKIGTGRPSTPEAEG